MKYRKHLIILIAYTVVAIVMTFPLVLNFGSAIPGLEGDATSFVWAMGWMKTAVMDLHVNPFHTDYVFYPLGGATQLMWAVSLVAFVSIPFQYILGLVATHNLFYLAATVLTAYGMYLLAEEILFKSKVQSPKAKVDLTTLPPFQTFLVAKFVLEQRRLALRSSPLAPFIAGLVFAFAPLRLGYGLSFLNLYNTELIPFYVLFLIRATRDRSWRSAIIAGVLLGLNAYIDFQIAAFLILFTALYTAFIFVSEMMKINHTDTQTPREFFRAFVPLWFITALTSLFIAAPILGIVANDFAIEGGNYIRVFPIRYSTDRSYDLLSYFVPNAWSSLYSPIPKIASVNAGANANDVGALSPDRQPFVGYIVLALAMFATVRQKSARFWSIAAILFWIFSLGPSLHIFGNDTGIPLPYLALHEIPIVNHIRIPMRYGIMVMFALAMLAAIAIQNLQFAICNSQFAIRNMHYPFGYAQGMVLRFTLLLLPVFVLLEYANLPYPMQPISIPRVYADIAKVPGDFTVLEIPTFNWRGAAATEVYQAMDGKRILRAYTNRIAPGPAEYFAYRGIPVIDSSLRVLEGAEKGPLAPEDIAQDKRVRDDVVRFFDLRYAVLHRLYLTPDQMRDIDAYLRGVLNARVISDEGDTVAYEIPPAPQQSGAVNIDLRESIGQMYAGRGWQFEYPQADYEGRFKFVWTRGVESEIYFVNDVLPRSFDSAAPSPPSPRDPAQDSSLAMTINAFAESPQRVTVLLNGERIGEMALSNTWQEYRVVLPAKLLRKGMNRVELQYGAELTETIGVTTITIE